MTVENISSVESCRLLILDDERDVGQTIVNMAQSLGIESKAVSSAEDFFSELAEFQPTHVAVDLMMPALDGIGVIRQMAERHTGVAIIIISGASARILEAAKRSAVEHGLCVTGVLGKPFSRKALMTSLQLRPGTVSRTAAGGHALEPGDLGSRVAKALADGAINIALQPKVSLSSGDLIGFEVLARWTDEYGVVIAPDRFIAAAEKAGLINALTETVMDKALKWLADHDRTRGLSIAVNVSAKSLQTDKLLTMIDAMCRRHALPPERLVIELTESEAVGDQTDGLDILTQLRLRKIELAIDDFGVGYSSLIQLARLPFSELKIDKRFVSDLTASHESHAIVAAIIGMANGLGLRTVAEGVEDLDTYNMLKAMGCHCAQGYFIGRPMSPEDAAHWIDTE